jgi:hypothetical protein
MILFGVSAMHLLESTEILHVDDGASDVAAHAAPRR